MRFSHDVIAHQTQQQISLYIQYFIGDGEAIVRSHIGYPADDIQIASVEARSGVARVLPTHIEVDYAEAPLTGVCVDTLYVDVSVLGRGKSLPLVVEIESSAANGVAHRHEALLRVEPGAQTSWSITPEQLYRGESARINLRVEHRDGLERPLQSVRWGWPKGIQPTQSGEVVWNGSLAVYDTLSQAIEVNVDEGTGGEQRIRAFAAVGGLPPIPLNDVVLRVDPLPVAEVITEVMDVGQERVIEFRWHNFSARSMAVEALQLEVNSAFSDVSLVDEDAGARLEIREGLRYVTVDGLAPLEPNEYIQIALRVKPQRPGPFTWRSFALPEGRDNFIALAGDLLVLVAWPEGKQAARGHALPTDLELVSESFSHALDEQMGALPIDRAVPIHLEGDVKDDANWVVEDVLGEVVRARGHRLLVQVPDAGEDAAIIRYRLVSSRVVYSPGGGLPFLGANKVREAYGDLVLRLVDQRDRVVRWERRIRSYKRDAVPSGSVDILGGEAVKRATIEADNKIIERGLSASIIGGLVYIFFIL